MQLDGQFAWCLAAVEFPVLTYKSVTCTYMCHASHPATFSENAFSIVWIKVKLWNR
jgi:hypothetical protein